MLGLILRPELVHRLLKQTHHRESILAACARDHGKIARNRRSLRRIEKAPLHITAHKQRNLARQHKDHTRKNRVAQLHNPNHGRTEITLPNMLKTAVHNPAGQIVPMGLKRMLERVRHMVGENEETLHQTGQQDDHHSERNIRNQIAKAALHKGECKERNYSGQRG